MEDQLPGGRHFELCCQRRRIGQRSQQTGELRSGVDGWNPELRDLWIEPDSDGQRSCGDSDDAGCAVFFEHVGPNRHFRSCHF
jgi:hypothetical protein